MRTSNPVLNENVFTNFNEPVTSARTMTLQGTVNRTFVLLGIVVFGACLTWRLATTSGFGAVVPWWIGGALVGFVAALVISFKASAAPYLSPFYALAQGLFLGAASAMFEQRFPGIVIQAVALTFGTLFFLLVAYTSRIIRATENFKLMVFAATGGIAMFYLVAIVLSLFSIHIPLIYSSGWIGIGFSIFVVAIAAMNLVLDFDFIENGASGGAPQYMEWYGAFGLMVTLIWLYVAILRLLAKMRSRD